MLTVHERQALATWWTQNHRHTAAVVDKLQSGPYTLQHMAWALGRELPELQAELRGRGVAEELIAPPGAP